jgi:hypothetical protein
MTIKHYQTRPQEMKDILDSGYYEIHTHLNMDSIQAMLAGVARGIMEFSTEGLERIIAHRLMAVFNHYLVDCDARLSGEAYNIVAIDITVWDGVVGSPLKKYKVVHDQRSGVTL